MEKTQQRDVKGLYAKAANAQLSNFTSIDSAYEPPTQPEIKIDTDQKTPEACTAFILDWIEKNPFIV